MRRGAFILTLAVVLSACGSSTNTYTLSNTRACLVQHGASIDSKLDFVASTATGGAFRAHLGGNFVTVVFGETVTDADNIGDAYRRFRGANVGIADVLRQQSNAVMLWHAHPSSSQDAAVTSCLS